MNMPESRAHLIREGKPRPIGFKPAMEALKSLRERAEKLEGEALLQSRQVSTVWPTGRRSLRESIGALPLSLQQVLKAWPEIGRSCKKPKKRLEEALRQGKIQGTFQKGEKPPLFEIGEDFEKWLRAIRLAAT